MLDFVRSFIIFSVPAPKFYVQLNPVTVIFDRDTCLWLNCFLLNLYKSLMDSQGNEISSSYTYIDVKIEAILPRVCIILFYSIFPRYSHSPRLFGHPVHRKPINISLYF